MNLPELLGILGGVLVIWGIAAVYWPAALVVGGVLVFGYAVAIGVRRRRASDARKPAG